MLFKLAVLTILSILIGSCGVRHSDKQLEQRESFHSTQSKPSNINIPLKDNNNLKFDNLDLSVTKKIKTNFNTCYENRYFKITVTNEIDSVSLDNNIISPGICEETDFSCEGTNTLHQTGARIIICPK